MNTFKNTYKKLNKTTHHLQLAIVFISVLVILCCILISIRANAKISTGNKYYTTIQIEEGDSLWSIAATYYSPDYSDYNEYIEEVKSINNMNNDNIKNGSYIVIPYYK